MNTFRQSLEACTEQQLERIFHLWGMDGLQEKGRVNRRDTLLQRIKDPIAARFVWEYLSPDESQVLYRILGHSARGGMRRDGVLKKSQLSSGDFDAVIANLQRYLLLQENTMKIRTDRYNPRASGSKMVTLYEDVAMLHPYIENVDALYTAGKELFSAKSDRSAMSFDKLMSSFYHGELNLIINHYAEPNVGYYSNAELRTMIEDELVQPNGAFEIIQQLDPPVRDLLKWLCTQGGRVSMQKVREHTHYDDPTLIATLHTLEEYALAFDTFSEQQRVLFVPTATLPSLKKAVMQTAPVVVPSGLVPLVEPPVSVYANNTMLLYDLAIIIGAIYQQHIEPTQAGRVPKRLASKIQPLLHGLPRIRYINEDDEYMEMLLHIAQELSIVRLFKPSMEGLKTHYEPGSLLAQWATMDVTEQTRRLVQCWLRSFSWLDIRGINFEQWDPYYWNPIGGRSAILEQLKNCVPGQWYSIASLQELLWDKDPFALRPPHYNIRGTDHRKSSAMRSKWLRCEGEVYIGFLASSLYELGIVAVGNIQASGSEAERVVNPDAFMLTELGAAVISASAGRPSTANASSSAPPSEQANGHRSLVLQPNFELLLLHPDFPTLYSLLPFAQVNQVEMVSRLTLTRASVLHGVEAGYDIEQILHTLEESSQKEIPQNVAYTLRDWIKLYKDVRISQAFLLEVSSEAVADEITQSTKFKAFNLRKLGSRILVAGNEINLAELRRTLDKEGILVHFSGDIITPQNRYAFSFGRPQ